MTFVPYWQQKADRSVNRTGGPCPWRRTRRTAPTQMEGTASGSNYDKTAWQGIELLQHIGTKDYSDYQLQHEVIVAVTLSCRY